MVMILLLGIALSLISVSGSANQCTGISGASGYALLFNGPGYDAPDMIRSTFYPNGLQDFTVIFYQQNLVPGYQPSLWGFGQSETSLTYTMTGSFDQVPSQWTSSKTWSAQQNGFFGYDYVNNVYSNTINVPLSDVIKITCYESSFVFEIGNSSKLQQDTTISFTQNTIQPFSFLNFTSNAWFMNALSYDSVNQIFEMTTMVEQYPNGPIINQTFTYAVADLASSLYWNYGNQFPPGFWTLGKDTSTGGEAGLAALIDEFCVYDTALSIYDITSVFNIGCASTQPSALLTNYHFDNDRSAVPNLFNSANNTYDGISNGAVNLANVYSDIGICGSAQPLSSGPYKVTSSVQLNCGNYVVVVRNTTISPVMVPLTCSGDCKFTNATSLPTSGLLCKTKPTLNSGCDSGTLLAANASLAGNIWFLPSAVSINGSLDSFVATITSSTGMTTRVNIDILTNSPPSVSQATSESNILANSSQVLFLPELSNSFIDIDTNVNLLQAVITSVTGNLASYRVYDYQNFIHDSTLTVDQNFANFLAQYPASVNLVTATSPYTITDLRRRIYVKHDQLDPNTYGNPVTLSFSLYDGMSYGQPMSSTISAPQINVSPRVVGQQFTIVENSSPLMIELSNFSFDFEGDNLHYEILNIDPNCNIFEGIHYSNGTMGVGDQMNLFNPNILQSLYASSASASSSFDSNHQPSGMIGPPDVYPQAVDIPGNHIWQASYTDYSYATQMYHTTVQLNYDTAVYASNVIVYWVSGPGSITEIWTLNPINVWERVYYTVLTTQLYCPDVTKSYLCTAKTEHNLRPTTYSTKSIQLVLVTNLFPSIDAVNLKGYNIKSNSLVSDMNGLIFLQPIDYFRGSCSVRFRATDISYFLNYGDLNTAGNNAYLTVNVTGVNHAPVINLNSPQAIFDVTPTSTAQVLSGLSFLDHDKNSLTVSVTSLPSNGVLLVNSSPMQANTQYPISASSGSPISFQPNACSAGTDILSSATINLVNNQGLSTSSVININVKCGNLPITYSFLAISDSLHVSLGIGIPIVGVSLCLCCLYFNIHFRTHVAIKSTSWRVNVITIVGCMFIFASMYFYSSTANIVKSCSVDQQSFYSDLDTQGANQNCGSDIGLTICTPKIALFLYGWVLAFGSIFAKTYRIAKIFNNKKMKKVSVTDNELFMMIGAGAFASTIFLLVWFIAFPLKGTFAANTPAIDVANQVLVITVLQSCNSPNYIIFNTLLLAFFGVSLFYGAYLSYQIRNIKETATIKNVNDSKEIAMAIYNILVLGGCCFAMASFTTGTPNTSFGIISAGAFICVILFLGLLFGPKFYTVITTLKVSDKSGGRKLSSSVASTTSDTGSGENNTVSLNEKDKALIETLKKENAKLKEQLRGMGVDLDRLKGMTFSASNPTLGRSTLTEKNTSPKTSTSSIGGGGGIELKRSPTISGSDKNTPDV